MKKQLLFSPLLILMIIIFASFSNQYQVTNTSLRITIRNDLGNLVENALVTLYATEEDYNNRENQVAEPAYTNQKGEVRFRNLQPISYYVDAGTEELSNYDGGVKTQRLEKGKTNKITIVIL